jgi:hypothetical protein
MTTHSIVFEGVKNQKIRGVLSIEFKDNVLVDSKRMLTEKIGYEVSLNKGEDVLLRYS